MNSMDFSSWPVWLQIVTGFATWVSLYPGVQNSASVSNPPQNKPVTEIEVEREVGFYISTGSYRLRFC